MGKKEKNILLCIPAIFFMFSNTIITMIILSFYGWVFIIWLFKVMPKD